MIWIPTASKLPMDTYKWVLVDEAQDLSAAQLRIIRSSLAEGGRMLAVGDPNQAIYAFAGADCNSFERVTELAGGTTLPLNVCYRCPKSHIKLAQEIVPTIEAADGQTRARSGWSNTTSFTKTSRARTSSSAASPRRW